MDKKNSLLMANMMSSSGGGEPNPPENVIFTKKDEYIELSGRRYFKKYDGLAYGGYFHYSGVIWHSICFVSTISKEACEADYSVVDGSTFERYGKTWFYTTGCSSMQMTIGTTVYEYVNGRQQIAYNIGEITPGATEALLAAQALVDYIYSFV